MKVATTKEPTARGKGVMCADMEAAGLLEQGEYFSRNVHEHLGSNWMQTFESFCNRSERGDDDDALFKTPTTTC
jgi:hypothetical protein